MIELELVIRKAKKWNQEDKKFISDENLPKLVRVFEDLYENNKESFNEKSVKLFSNYYIFKAKKVFEEMSQYEGTDIGDLLKEKYERTTKHIVDFSERSIKRMGWLSLLSNIVLGIVFLVQMLA